MCARRGSCRSCSLLGGLFQEPAAPLLLLLPRRLRALVRSSLRRFLLRDAPARIVELLLDARWIADAELKQLAVQLVRGPPVAGFSLASDQAKERGDVAGIELENPRVDRDSRWPIEALPALADRSLSQLSKFIVHDSRVVEP